MNKYQTLSTCHTLRFKEALSLRARGKDEVMMLLCLASQSNEFAFVKYKKNQCAFYVYNVCAGPEYRCVLACTFFLYIPS